jgi:hypothetical protein
LKEQIFIIIISVQLNLSIICINLFHFSGEYDLSDVCSCDRVIESLTLIEPLISKISVSVPHQSRVAWQNILLSANSLNVIFDRREYLLVAESDCKWIPSLTDFGILNVSDLKIFIDFSCDLIVHVLQAVQKLACENYFQIDVVSLIQKDVLIGWRRITCKGDILICKILEGCSICSSIVNVRSRGNRSRCLNPGNPVNRVNDALCLRLIFSSISVHYIFIKGKSQFEESNGHVGVFLKVKSQKVLEVTLAIHLLHKELHKLLSFLISDQR